MNHKLTVYINNESIVEYDRNKRLPGKQREYLDKMDSDMDGGFKLGDEQIDNPDNKARAKFVAMTLIHSIEANNEQMIVATCAYLASREPGLTEVRATAEGENMMMDLIYDQGAEVAFSRTLN
ncbi:MAG: hypothetical protein OEY29_10880 [Gammaproteobacteria bacterium]|nr:hypothetical protein [Gammaproteobacteria bacterium]